MESAAIGNLTSGDVYPAVVLTLRGERDVRFMADFLSRLDWDAITDNTSEFAETLLDLLNWTTMAEAGELSAQQYAQKLRGVLPTGGVITFEFTKVPVPQGPGPVVELVRSAQPPQTGSVAPTDRATPATESNNVQVLLPTG